MDTSFLPEPATDERPRASDGMPGLLQIDAQGRIVLASGVSGVVSGGDAVGQPVEAVFAGDTDFLELCRQGLLGQAATGRVRLDGRSVAVRVEPQRDRGDVTGVLVALTPVRSEPDRLADAERQFRLAHWSWRRETDSFHLSPSFSEWSGLEIGGPLAIDDLAALVAPADRPRLREMHEEIRLGHAIRAFRVRIGDGGPGERILRVVPTRDEAARGKEGFVQDVTELVRIGQDLASTEELYRALALHFADGFVVVLDSERRHASIDGTGPYFGFESRTDLLGRSVREAYPSHLADRVEQALADTQPGAAMELEDAVGEEVYVIRVVRLPVGDPARHALLVATRVTRRRRLEDALRLSEERYRTLLRHFPSGAVFFLDRGLRYRVAEGASLAAAGIDRNRLLGRSIADVLAPDVYEALRAQCLLSLNGRATENEIDFLGETYVTQTVPLRVSSGFIEGCMIVLRNVTRERALERRLQEAERVERLRVTAALDGAPDAIAIADPAGRILYLNPAHRDLLRYAEEELNETGGMKALLVNRAHAGRIFANLRRRQPWSGEVELRAKTGRVVPVVLRASPIRDPEGRMVGIASIATDISERRRSEEALRQREEMFRLLFDLAPIGMAVLDTDRRFARVNGALLDLLGLRESDVLGRTMDEFTHSDDRALDAEQLDLLESGAARHRSWEKRFIGREGRTLPTVMNVVLTTNVGGRPLLLAQVVDIGQIRQAEAERQRLLEQIFQAQKMEALGTLAGGVAHDFNNILSALMGFVWLAHRQAQDPDRVRGFLEKAQKAGERASAVVRQILTFGNKNVDFQRRPVDPNTLIDEAAGLLRATLPATIELRLPERRCDELVLADPNQLHQILMNVAINAAHAIGKEPGTIALGCEVVEVSGTVAARSGFLRGEGGQALHFQQPAEDGTVTALLNVLAPGRYVRFRCRDSGAGMSQTTMARMFEPFFTTKGVGGGSGLGLSVVMGLVKAHGGGCVVRSREGWGTEFDVILPVAEQEPKIALAEASSPALRPGRVLVVDDEADVVEVLSATLAALGMQVVGTVDPHDALHRIMDPGERWDAVITDLTMPKMTGDRLIREIRRVRPKLPIILCTGFNEGITQAELSRLRVASFLKKPISSDVLASALSRVLES